MSNSKSAALNDWMAGYRRAWESNDPSDISVLFTADAVYYNEPFSPPARGIDAILSMWQQRNDAPGSTTFSWSPLVATDEVCMIQGETDYGSVTFSNLWVIRLGNDGHASEFTEWWMDQSKPSSESI